MGKITKRMAVIGTTTALAIGGGLAWAAWTASGSGSGNAQAGSAQTLTVSTVAPSGTLSPNSSVDLTFTVTNPNPYNVSITTITATSIVVDSGHNVAHDLGGTPVPACNVADSVGFVLPSDFAPFTVSKNHGTATPTLGGALIMNNAANDGCQGATFTVTLALTGASA
jgi:hypothetical protein